MYSSPIQALTEAIQAVDNRPRQAAEQLAWRLARGDAKLHSSWPSSVKRAYADVVEQLPVHDYDPRSGRKSGLDSTVCSLMQHDLYGVNYSHSRDVLVYRRDCMAHSADANGLSIQMTLVNAAIDAKGMS